MGDGRFVRAGSGQFPEEVWPYAGATVPYGFRFFPEYSADSPFWSDEGGLVPIEDLPLSDGLKAELVAWNDYFEREYYWETGWRDKAGGADFNEQGRVLCERAQVELGTDYALRYHPWPGS